MKSSTFDCLDKILQTAAEEALLCTINGYLASILEHMDEIHHSLKMT